MTNIQVGHMWRLNAIDQTAFETLTRDSHTRDSFLQSPLWANHKSRFGWQAHYFKLNAENIEIPLLVLTRKVFAQKYLAYIPHGPSISAMDIVSGNDERSGLGLKLLARAICEKLKLPVLAVRFEPLFGPRALDLEIEALELDHETDALEKAPLIDANRKRFELWRKTCFLPHLRKAPGDIQPPDTVIVDLKPDSDAILAKMRSKTRYNIRLSSKKGIEIRVLSTVELDQWYALYQETAIRDKISIHSKAYYQSLLEENPQNVELIGAFHEGEFLAGIIVLYDGERAVYVYGASSNNKRNLMPAYGLQWFAMERAKSKGAESYDMFGLPPWADPGHPMSGLFQFKTGFSLRVSHAPGAWDHPVSKILYNLYRLLEAIRLYYFRVLKKR